MSHCYYSMWLGVLFLVRFNNFNWTTGFYWSYTCLLKQTNLMHSWFLLGLHMCMMPRAAPSALLHATRRVALVSHLVWVQRIVQKNGNTFELFLVLLSLYWLLLLVIALNIICILSKFYHTSIVKASIRAFNSILFFCRSIGFYGGLTSLLFLSQSCQPSAAFSTHLWLGFANTYVAKGQPSLSSLAKKRRPNVVM